MADERTFETDPAIAADRQAPEKSAEAFRTITEVGEALDVQAHVLRFWESKFGQIRPLKRGGGRRYYRPGDVALLKGIKGLLHGHGYTIRGVQKILREKGTRFVMDVGEGTIDPRELATLALTAAVDDRSFAIVEDALRGEETNGANGHAPQSLSEADRRNLEDVLDRLLRIRTKLRTLATLAGAGQPAAGEETADAAAGGRTRARSHSLV